MGRYDDIEHIAKLHQEGALSDDEFQKEKTRILSQTDTPPSATPTQENRSSDTILIPVSPRSRLFTLLLCLFFGTLGVHRFYTGKRKSAILMLIFGLSTVFSCSKLFTNNPFNFVTSNSTETGWEYFGELTSNNSLDTQEHPNPFLLPFVLLVAFCASFFTGTIIFFWKLIDLIAIISGQFKDGKKRTVLRW